MDWTILDNIKWALNDAWEQISLHCWIALKNAGLPVKTRYIDTKKFVTCPNPDCNKLARWVDKKSGVYHCFHCGASPQGLEFD